MVRSRLLAGLVVCLAATASFAVVPPDQSEPLHQKELRHPDLIWGSQYLPVAELPTEVSGRLAPELNRLGVDPGHAFLDLRTGRWGTLIVTRPLIPGSGVGNALAWSDLGRQAPRNIDELKDAAWQAFKALLAENAGELRFDLGELTEPTLSAHGERVIQIHVGRHFDGIPVRDTFITAAVNSGNLVLMGQRNWADVAIETAPAIAAAAAEEALRRYLDGIAIDSFNAPAHLEIVPASSEPLETLALLEEGLQHRLAWVLSPIFAGDLGTWEALVDAHSGELLAFTDLNHYASRRVEGGIYPVSNDQAPPDGVELPGYPMPFANISLDGTPIGFTTTGGNVPPGADSGTISTTLSGRYVRMDEQCGAINESSASGDLDLEHGPGTDCTVPAGHSAGDTHSSRTGFYELNRLAEQARGYLPDNNWLDQQLTARMNINQSCNAFWNGAIVGFYRSSATCRNTGEIAAIFDHEWGHGMDANDGNPGVSRPGEGIADIFAHNRLNESCIGRGFFQSGNCGGYGNPCIDCSGVRNTDWMQRVNQQPAGAAQAVACGTGGNIGPCGRTTHCEGYLVGETAWDLVHRDLQGFEDSDFEYDLNTALELGTRLSYYGSHNVFNWYQCNWPDPASINGCNADSGYLGFLAADDDNGDLTDGTPHMTAIFAAFDRHDIACPTPVQVNSGCAGGPTQAPTNLIATPLNEGAQLSWNSVPDASEYWIFRTEGVHGCDFGKARVGITSSTTFTETGLRNDFEVLYSVVAVGDNDACTSPMSACEAVSPISGPGLGFDATPLVWAEQSGGDGDEFFDNCETGLLEFGVVNTGIGDLTDVRIVSATIPSHPEVQILTGLPATITASLPEGAGAGASLQVLGGGMAFNETLEIEITVTSDELDPLTFTKTYTLGALESDLELQPSLTFSFEDGEDGWELVSGIFDRTDTGGGAEGTDFYRASSTGLNLQCDRIRSPLLQLTAASTLEIFNQFNIEGFDGTWWDRANVGVFDPEVGDRTVVSPDGGRTYNASGVNAAPAPCASDDPPGQPGWAGAGPDWMPSTWSAGALGSPGLTDRLIRLDVAYGTDPAVTGTIGFWFDEVTVTDVYVQVPDGQSDKCVAGSPELVFDPGMLEFGDVNEGETSPAQFATLHNTGDANATGLGFSELDSGFDADTSDCGETLPSGDECVVSVTFTPDVSGPAAATLLANSFEGPSAEVDLTGNGVSESALFVAVALEVDANASVSDGNRVFEPGESVEVAPAWRNDGAAAEGLLGSAGNLSGPAGASYVLIGDSASYGLVQPGDTASCQESSVCYEVGVNDPVARPATHWEATFVETLSDDTAKTWRLHIGDSFDDVPRASPFYRSVETLLRNGVTGGCSDTEYCPTATSTRGQMPVFVLRAKEGTDYVPPACVAGAEMFTDVPATNGFCPWIQDLANRGVVAGCGGDAYCPNSTVNRQQMAIFLLRTIEGDGYTPPPCTGIFADVPCSSPFAAWVEELYNRDVTGGCGSDPLIYCPTASVNRQQMAVFVTAAFELALYGP